MERKEDSYKPYSGETESDTQFNLFVDSYNYLRLTDDFNILFNSKEKFPELFTIEGGSVASFAAGGSLFASAFANYVAGQAGIGGTDVGSTVGIFQQPMKQAA